MRLRGLHPQVREAADWAVRYAESQGVPVTITSGYRTWADQADKRRKYERCVAQGRFPWAEGCRYPANRPGDSAHNWGLAFDSWVPEPYWPFWDAVKVYAGFRTYPQTDRVHGEYPGWRSVVRGWPKPTSMGWR